MKRTFIGSFPNHERMATKIQDLKIEGVQEQDMYIVLKDQLAIDQLKKHATQEGSDSPFNLFNRFLGFLAGENNVRRMLRDSGFTDQEAKHYFDAVQEGALLLYIDGELDKNRNSDNANAGTRFEHFKHIPLDEVEAEHNR